MMKKEVASGAVNGAVNGIASEAYKDGREAIRSVVQNINYVKDLGKNYRKMTEEAEKLYARRKDIQVKVDIDSIWQSTNEYEAWISRVNEIEKEVVNLETEYQSKKKNHNYLSHHKLSKRMAKMCEELHVVWEEGKFESGTVNLRCHVTS